MRKLFSCVTNILFGVLVVFAVLSMISFATTKITKDPIPTVGKYKFMSVLSNSMVPIFQVYDLVIDEKTSEDKLKVGDVISFKEDSIIITHRIVSVKKDSNKTFYQTKGDANNVEDSKLVSPEDVTGKYLFRIPKGGLVLAIINGPIGMALIWVLFMFMIFKEILEEVKKKKNNKNINVMEESK